MRKNEPRSLLMMTAAMLIYGSIGVFRRYIPLSSAALACFRGLSGAVFLLLVCLLRRRRLNFRLGAKRLGGLILSGAMIGLNWILLFEAYRYTTVAVATLCYYMAPTGVMLLSPLVLGERLTARKLVCAALALFGMLLVSGLLGGAGGADLRGIAFGLGAAALYAAVVLLNKKLPGIDAFEKTIVQLGSAGLVLVPYVLLRGIETTGPMTTVSVVLLIVVGLVHTGLAYTLYFGSMDGLRAQTVAILSYLDPVTALLLGGLLLGEPLTPAGIAGAVLILGSAAAAELLPEKRT